MLEITQIILTIVAPILLIAGLGAVLDRVHVIEVRSVSRILIYLASPSLAFHSLANSTIQKNEVLELFIVFISVNGSVAIIAWLVARLAKLDRMTSSAFVLSVSLINMGNLGIPFNEFAFGQAGFERAVLLAVFSMMWTYTVGIFIASAGQASILRSVRNVFTVPLPYAVLLGFAVNDGYIAAPEMLMRTTRVLGGAAVPMMLVVLGVQISRISLQSQWRVMLGAAALRLVLTAGIAIGVSHLLSLDGITRQVAILQNSMPTAVASTVLATEFKSDAKLVSSIILISTLGSVFTLSILLAWLR